MSWESRRAMVTAGMKVRLAVQLRTASGAASR